MESKNIVFNQPDYAHSEFWGKPTTKISKVYIKNQSCKPFVEDTACCLTDNGLYTPFRFTSTDGWQNIAGNEKMNLNCNSKDFDKLKLQLDSKLYD